MRFRDFKETLAQNGIKMLFFMGRILLEGKHERTFETEIRLNDSINAPRNDSLREYPDVSEKVSDTLNEEVLDYYREQIE